MTNKSSSNLAIESAAVAAKTAAEAAVVLGKTAADTAPALARAKADADGASAVLTHGVAFIKAEIGEIKDAVKILAAKDGNYVLKEDFTFWRNLLVSGMLTTIALAAMMRVLLK